MHGFQITDYMETDRTSISPKKDKQLEWGEEDEEQAESEGEAAGLLQSERRRQRRQQSDYE